MTAWWLAGIAWFITTLVVVPVAFVVAVVAAGPHSSVLPIAVLLKSELAEAIESSEASGKTTAITAWKNAWLARDAQARFVVDGSKTNQKLLAAADVYDDYLTELKARELFDYDDMILRAVHALETNNDLRFTLQEQ